DGMIGISFHMHHLRRDVFGFVTQRVDDHAATDRAVGAGGSCFRRAGDLEARGLRVGRLLIEAENGRNNAAGANLEKGSAGRIHGVPSLPPINLITYPVCTSVKAQVLKS